MESPSDATMMAAIVGGALGAIPGIWALVARWRDRRKSCMFVHLRLNVYPGNVVTARTSVENRITKSNEIVNAMLLVGPEKEDPRETMKLLGYTVTLTNEIAEIRLQERKVGIDGRCLIPLPFYYSENVAIADEEISYTSPIDITQISKGTPYSVRFFVLPSGRLHRTTQDCFVLPS